MPQETQQLAAPSPGATAGRPGRRTFAGGRPIIQVKDLACTYSGQMVIENVSFDIQRGEIVFIAGGSGSGKSTVLKHLIGLMTPARGTILIDGENLSTATGPERDRILRKFGISFQSGALFGSMTVLQNVRLPLEEFARLGGNEADMIALIKLHMVGLEDSAPKLPSELSGGMQKCAAIARAIALDPLIVFMDEPSAGLDPITSAELDRLILSLNTLLGTTFVIISHELASILSIADRVLLLDGKRKTLVAEGDPRELGQKSDDPWVRAFFNRTTPEDEEQSGHAGDAAKPPAVANTPETPNRGPS